ncbi:MAG TPA: DUF6036 family nucleotidyltransferase [Thermoanaerobaculia bacterium]|nr:DUF6036 family nucleotidyltransferase [Thermoanaerobaculia bacterium]
MRREDLEHLIRASAQIADDEEIVVIGSQAILGQFPDAPPELLVSDDADLYPRQHPERADLIDGSIGELSPFHLTYGYYAHGVGPETATLPRGWERRLVPIDSSTTPGARGLCLEVHDLLVAKYAAGRPKDRAFARTVAVHGLADRPTLLERLAATELAEESRQRLRSWIEADFPE